jgi:thioredoxin reductase (NADPH)
VLAASSLPSASGLHLLEHVRQLHPHARRALLVPAGVWADQPTADAIRDSIALGRIDSYVQRPADSHDEVFHEAVSSFLLEWARDQCVVPQTVHVVGETWSGRAFELRAVLEQCSTPHSFCLAESEQGCELLAGRPDAKLPVMVLPDGRVLSDPSNAEIAEVAGAPAALDGHDFDVAIVGAGPAGLSAAVYGASEGLRVLVIDQAGIGGQARSSSLIRNYLGFAMGVSGSRLAEQAYEQAVAFGASFLFMHRATALARSGQRLTVSIEDGRRVDASAVILASGATYRRLDVPSLEALRGAGVFYGGPVSEARALKEKEAYVVGGGNAAGQAAVHLARYARRVTVLVRGPSLEAGMSHYLVQAIEAAPNVEVRTGTTVAGGGGDGYLQHLVLRESGGKEETVAADALFVLIGARPHVDWLPPEIARDEHGFLLTGADLDGHDWPLERRPAAFETSMPGVLAIGDVRHASVKRVAAAVGAGAIAVQLIHGLLVEEPQLDARTETTAHR